MHDLTTQVQSFSQASTSKTDSTWHGKLLKLADYPGTVIARASIKIKISALSVKDLAHLVVDEGELVMGYGFKEDLDQIAQNVPKGVQIFLCPRRSTSKSNRSAASSAPTLDICVANKSKG